MKKAYLFIPTIVPPVLTIASAISSYSITTQKTTKSKTNAQTDVNNYSIVAPSWTHYAIGEKLDLRDLKVTYNDPEKGAIDVTNECELSMQNDQELTQEGEFDVNIQHNDFNTSFKIYVEKEPTEVPCADNIQKMDNIDVEFKLMSNQECIFTDYDSGEGILEIPDCVDRDGIKYFVKQIPSDWSDGENDIRGLKFNKNVRHLRKICDKAFKGTNCLDYYINNRNEPLVFPEGLEEIGEDAFAHTDWGQDAIKGYSFPSTLKKIGSKAFGNHAPYIDGDGANGELTFRSIPEIASDAFYICGVPTHNCKYIYGSIQEIVDQIIQKIRNDMCDDFYCGFDYLCPRIVSENAINVKLGNITVECVLSGDECLIQNYVGGTGTLVIPDHIEKDNKIYYIKQILTDWSRDEKNITGLEFAPDCTHLKKICAGAFYGTRCLDEYMHDNSKLLKFPEGLEEIEQRAFSGTCLEDGKIKGYSFPSTLKKIGRNAFGYLAPHIEGYDGELEFRSIPEIASTGFACGFHNFHHECKYIYANSMEIAFAIKNLIAKDLVGFLKTGDFLIPRLLENE